MPFSTNNIAESKKVGDCAFFLYFGFFYDANQHKQQSPTLLTDMGIVVSLIKKKNRIAKYPLPLSVGSVGCWIGGYVAKFAISTVKPPYALSHSQNFLIF